jgi:hypothetical protein
MGKTRKHIKESAWCQGRSFQSRSVLGVRKKTKETHATGVERMRKRR